MHERICDLMGADGDGVLDALSALARTERELTADLVAHLCVTDERRLFVPRGYSSLFRYATAVLGWTEAKAFHRIAVARAARRYPVIVDDLAAGRLSVSGVAVLAPHLSDDDGEALLASARGKSKRQLEALVAGRSPRPDVPARIRPLGDDRFAVSFTVSGSVCDKLERARALCSHVIPDGDLAAVFERALDVLIARADTRRHGSARASAVGRDAPIRSDAIPAHVRRAVFDRDGGRCTFVGDRGDRCPETQMLEYHHQIARGHGGPPTVDNVSLLCAIHNRHLGERDFPGVAARVRARRAAASRRDDVVASVASGLRNLGFGAVDSRRAAAAAWRGDEPEPELEAVLRRALRCVGVGAAGTRRPGPSPRPRTRPAVDPADL